MHGLAPLLIVATSGCASTSSPAPTLAALVHVDTPAPGAEIRRWESPDEAPVVTPCPSASPLIVTENTTGIRGDLCKPSLAAFARLQAARAPIPAAVELRVRLEKLSGHSSLKCAIAISMYSNGVFMAQARGRASVAAGHPATHRAGVRDCVDAVIDDLMIRQVAGWMLVQAQITPAAATPTAPPTPVPPPSATP